MPKDKNGNSALAVCTIKDTDTYSTTGCGVRIPTRMNTALHDLFTYCPFCGKLLA